MIAALLLAATALADTPDRDAEVRTAILDELQRNFDRLSLPDAPPLYHLRYHVVRMHQVDARTSLGSPVYNNSDPFSGLGVEVRVGDPSFDNSGFGGWQNGFDRVELAVEPTEYTVRLDAWRLTDRAYKQAVEQYARKAAQFSAPEDYPGDYALAGATVADDGSAPAGEADQLHDLALELSAAFKGPIPLERGEVYLGHEAGYIWTVDTEGTDIRRPLSETTIRAVAHLRADDGMLLTDQRLWTVRQPDQLPARTEMVAEAGRMGDALIALADAPTLDGEYVGPVLFTEDATIDLFRYVLVPLVEGTPPDIPFDSYFGELGSDLDPVRMSRRVLPVGWTASDDPLRNPTHPGWFAYDWEGTPAQEVEVVRDGIVTDVLMSRVPRKGIEQSNGHARSFLGDRARGRVSQLEVQPPKHASYRQLVKRGLKMARAYDRDYILVVRRLQEPSVINLTDEGGYLMFGATDDPQLPPPVSVVRVHADGTEVELRGAAFAGVQRWILRDIQGAGPQRQASFMAPAAGSYGALQPTEGLGSWLSAPDVLIGEVELVPRPSDPTQIPTLAPPELATRGK